MTYYCDQLNSLSTHLHTHLQESASLKFIQIVAIFDCFAHVVRNENERTALHSPNFNVHLDGYLNSISR